MKVLITP